MQICIVHGDHLKIISVTIWYCTALCFLLFLTRVLHTAAKTRIQFIHLPSVQGMTIIKNAQAPPGVRFLGGYYIRDTYLNAHFHLYGSNPELLEVSYRVTMYFARPLCLVKLCPVGWFWDSIPSQTLLLPPCLSSVIIRAKCLKKKRKKEKRKGKRCRKKTLYKYTPPTNATSTTTKKPHNSPHPNNKLQNVNTHQHWLHEYWIHCTSRGKGEEVIVLSIWSSPIYCLV